MSRGNHDAASRRRRPGALPIFIGGRRQSPASAHRPEQRYNRRIRNSIVVQITTNLARANERAHLLIDISTAHGKQTGLLHNSVVSCLNLATLTDDRLDRVIGRLPDALMAQVDARLKIALGLS